MLTRLRSHAPHGSPRAVSLSSPPRQAPTRRRSVHPTPGGTETDGSPVAIVVEGPTGTIHTIRIPGPGVPGGGSATTTPAGAIGRARPPRACSRHHARGRADRACWQCVDDAGASCSSRCSCSTRPIRCPGSTTRRRPRPGAGRRCRCRRRRSRPVAPLGSRSWSACPPGCGWPTGRTRQATATLDGVTATVTATPTCVRPGRPARRGPTSPATGPGTAYDPTRPADAQHSTCTLLFETAGPEQLTATVTYAVSWTASTGDHGDLDPLTRRATPGPGRRPGPGPDPLIEPAGEGWLGVGCQPGPRPGTWPPARRWPAPRTRRRGRGRPPRARPARCR